MKELLTQYAPFPLTDAMLDKFALYADMLVEWNARMNLTAVADPLGIAQKHFADSLIVANMLPTGAECIDVGTGAGFPGVPLLIARSDLKMSLLDSLQKRLDFLSAVCDALCLRARLFHARAEEGGRRSDLRGHFDAVFSRAVAPMNVLCELTLPFCKTGGAAYCYKGPSVQDELRQARRALFLLGGEIESANEEEYPWGRRTVVVVRKVRKTPNTYPRKAGTPSKEPL